MGFRGMGDPGRGEMTSCKGVVGSTGARRGVSGSGVTREGVDGSDVACSTGMDATEGLLGSLTRAPALGGVAPPADAMPTCCLGGPAILAFSSLGPRLVVAERAPRKVRVVLSNGRPKSRKGTGACRLRDLSCFDTRDRGLDGSGGAKWEACVWRSVLRRMGLLDVPL